MAENKKSLLTGKKVWVENIEDYRIVLDIAKSLGFQSSLLPSKEIKSIYFYEDYLTHQEDDKIYFQKHPNTEISFDELVKLTKKNMNKKGLENLPKHFSVETRKDISKCLAVVSILHALGAKIKDNENPIEWVGTADNWFFGLSSGLKSVEGFSSPQNNHFSFKEFLSYISGEKQYQEITLPKICGYTPVFDEVNNLSVGCKSFNVKELLASIDFLQSAGIQYIVHQHGKIYMKELKKIKEYFVAKNIKI